MSERCLHTRRSSRAQCRRQRSGPSLFCWQHGGLRLKPALGVAYFEGRVWQLEELDRSSVMITRTVADDLGRLTDIRIIPRRGAGS